MRMMKDTIENQIVINKSKFITTLIRVDTIEDVEANLAAIRKKYYDATHNCYGYILGTKGEIQKCSDDGEPSKTAGFPILDVLQKQKVTNILCVVTRYFGGTLLGTGGLVRAYSSSASEALKLPIFYAKESLLKLEIKLSYSNYNNILFFLNNYTILETIFDSEVTIITAIKQSDKTMFFTDLTNLTNAKVEITELGFHDIEVIL